MSSITRGPRQVPGSVDLDNENSLTNIAERQGLFQSDGADDGAEKSGKGGKAGKGAAKAGKAGGVGTAPAPGGFDTSGVVGAASGTVPGGSAVLPDPATEPSAGTADLKALDADPTDAALNDATTKLSKDLADKTTTQATFEADIANLKDAMTAAGVTAPVGQVVNDLIDPTGANVHGPTALKAAAQAQGVDLTEGSTDLAQAKADLSAALAANPPAQAAVDLATAHVTRAAGLSGSDGYTALTDVAGDLSSSDKGSALAALYAAAAKNGVDLSDSGEDAAAKAANKKAQASMMQQQNAAVRQQQQEAHGTGGGSSSSGEGSQGNPDASAKPVNYSGGEPSNTTQYGSIAKTGSGSSAGGWDTTGNDPIAPNPDNPVDFEKDYGIKGGFTSESLDDLLAKVPQLTSQYPDIKNTLETAAASVSPPVPPQLLLSTLGVETSYACNFGSNAKDGPFQFIESTFAAYGSGDRTNMADAAKACAHHYATLLQQNGMDLYAAMRDYNGDVTQGASNSYQADQQQIFNGNTDLAA